MQRAILAKIVTNHGGSVVTSERDATHVVFLDPREGVDDEGAEYLRSIDKRDNMVLVHYW